MRFSLFSISILESYSYGSRSPRSKKKGAISIANLEKEVQCFKLYLNENWGIEEDHTHVLIKTFRFFNVRLVTFYQILAQNVP